MPKKFQFPFEKLRRIRRFKTKEAQRRLGESYGKLYLREEWLQNLKESAAIEQENLERLISGGKVDKGKTDVIVRTLEVNDSEQKTCIAEIKEIEVEIEERRVELQEAVKEEEKFNKYREKMYENYKKVTNRKEMKIIDETASRLSFEWEGKNV
ncbi:MAG: hypothetical protein GF307_07520 [candidate division Zixibacteria bacterium]|nr:hypothetical protein [candidate division Zixibacteria bacterium]